MTNNLPSMAMFATGLALTISCGPTTADEEHTRCIGRSDGTNVAWSDCGAEYQSRMEIQLDDAWEAVFPQLTAEGQVLLRVEQQAWIAFAATSCQHLANGDYGREGQVMHFHICRGKIFEQRIQYLRELGEFVRPR